MCYNIDYDCFLVQGLYHYLKEDGNWFICSYSLKTNVDGNLLQRALDNVLMHTNYYNLRIFEDDNSCQLMWDERPCVVYKSVSKEILPEFNEDRLFYLSWKDNKVYLEIHHFLADGKSAFRFLNAIMISYCELMNGACSESISLMTDTPYVIGEDEKVIIKNEIIQTPFVFGDDENSNLVNSYRIVISRTDLIKIAVKYQAKPFCVLIALFCKYYMNVTGKTEIILGYPVDAREHIDRPNALYNASVSVQQIIQFDGKRFDEILDGIELAVNTMLDRKYISNLYKKQLFAMQELYESKISMKKKKRTMKMLHKSKQRIDVYVSYVGNLLKNATEQLREIVFEGEISLVPESEMNLFTEIVSIDDKFIMSVSDWTGNKKAENNFISLLTENEIKVF